MTSAYRAMVRMASVAAAAACVAVALIAVPGTGSATTGDTYVLPPSQYLVPPLVMREYYGSYHMTSAAKGSRLTGADIFVTRNRYHDLYGGGNFYGYDATGTPTDWTNVIYDFRLVPPAGAAGVRPWLTPGQAAGDWLEMNLYGWGSPSLGTMRLRRLPDGSLTGTIRLRGRPAAYRVSFRRTGPATARD
jgi:hypothetical protein